MKQHSPSDPLDDPAIAAMVDGAVARYRDTLSPAEIDALRSILAIQLASHPVLSRLMTRVRPRAAPLASTEAEVGADPPTAPDGAVFLHKRPGKKAQGAG